MKPTPTWRIAGFILIISLFLAACTGVRQPAEPTATETPAAGPADDTETPTTEEPGVTESPDATTQPATPTLSPDTSASEYPAATQSGDAPLPYPGAISVPEPYGVQTADAELSRSQAFVEDMDVLTMESFPPQFLLVLAGNMPTPCHQLRIEIAPPDSQNEIAVTVYSLVDPNKICTQVLEPFEVRFPLQNIPSGSYTVLVNDETAGEIEMP